MSLSPNNDVGQSPAGTAMPAASSCKHIASAGRPVSGPALRLH